MDAATRSAERGEKMRLNTKEKEICKQYSRRDEHNLVHCFECPLVISVRDCSCKANVSKRDYDEWEVGNEQRIL